LTLTTNIQRNGHDIDQGTQITSRAIPAALDKKLVNFYLQTKKVIDADVDLPKFKIRRDFGQLQTLTANIITWSGSTYRKSISNLIDCHPLALNQNNLVNFGPLTNKLQARILTNP